MATPLNVVRLMLIFVLLASAIALQSCSFSPSSPTLPSQSTESKTMSLSLTSADSGKTLEVNSGDTLSIQLPENPTTGYRWAMAAPEAEIQNLELQSSEYSPANSGIGAGGQRTFTFHAKSAGTSHLQLKEWRQWEGDRSILNRFELTVQVK